LFFLVACILIRGIPNLLKLTSNSKTRLMFRIIENKKPGKNPGFKYFERR